MSNNTSPEPGRQGRSLGPGGRGVRLVLVPSLFVPVTCPAEVIDKIASPGALWTHGLALGLLAGAFAFAVSRRRPFGLIVVAAAIGLAARRGA